MDQDKTTVMGGYGSPRTGNGADETRVVPNPGYAAPDTTQASADSTRVVNYGNAAQDPYGASSQSPYGNAAADPYDDLLQNPIPQHQQTTYMPRTAQPRYDMRASRIVSIPSPSLSMARTRRRSLRVRRA